MTTLNQIQARVASTEKMFSGPHDVMPTHYTDRAQLLAALRAVEAVVDSHKLGNGHIAREVHAAIQQALDG